MKDYMRKRCQMLYSSKSSKVCLKEHKQSEPATGNKNDDTALLQKQKEWNVTSWKSIYSKYDKIWNTV